MEKSTNSPKIIRRISVVDTLRAMPVGSEIIFHPRQATYNTVKSAIRTLTLRENMNFILSCKGGLDTKVTRLKNEA